MPTINCAFCGRHFKLKHRYPHQRYCSVNCQQRMNRWKQRIARSEDVLRRRKYYETKFNRMLSAREAGTPWAEMKDRFGYASPECVGIMMKYIRKKRRGYPGQSKHQPVRKRCLISSAGDDNG